MKKLLSHKIAMDKNRVKFFPSKRKWNCEKRSQRKALKISIQTDEMKRLKYESNAPAAATAAATPPTHLSWSALCILLSFHSVLFPSCCVYCYQL